MDKLKSYRPEVPDRLPNDPQPEIIYPHAVALSAVDTGGGASLGKPVNRYIVDLIRQDMDANSGK